jgi:hypothetical protein
MVSRRRGRAELKRLRTEVAELERRLSQLRWAVARIDHLASRVSVPECWCPFLPPGVDAGDPGDALTGGDPEPVTELANDTG